MNKADALLLKTLFDIIVEQIGKIEPDYQQIDRWKKQFHENINTLTNKNTTKCTEQI